MTNQWRNLVKILAQLLGQLNWSELWDKQYNFYNKFFTTDIDSSMKYT